MTLRAALLILQSHQKWRLGYEDTPMIVPYELTEAIGTILQYHNEQHEDNLEEIPTSSQTEISDEEIEKSMRRYNITDFGQMAAYITGAKWYREQLKQRQ